MLEYDPGAHAVQTDEPAPITAEAHSSGSCVAALWRRLRARHVRARVVRPSSPLIEEYSPAGHFKQPEAPAATPARVRQMKRAIQIEHAHADAGGARPVAGGCQRKQSSSTAM